MPPSPALRPSPGREIRMENHKRGRSLEGGLLVKEKEDDLALFKEMQNREKDDFLLDSTDDFEDSLSTRLRYFSDYKLGVTIPARGESSDLLNVDADKNDYDWLLTPPDTPLFASLEDETPSLNPPHRGRPRSQPISISRSTTAEKSYRSSRGSASPHRLSPSPQSSSSTLQSRGRTLSAHHSSSTPILRPTTPSRSPSRSTTPNKSLTPAPRSSTPTPRRMSTGSSVTVTSSGRMGSSPVKASRGNSSSPKLGAWQSNIPGFSTDAPPNLRTSLADRPASYVRGSSPASRNGRGVSPASSNGRGLSPVSTSARGLSPASRNGRESFSKRQSMSPTASRSASSSCSHDRDQFSYRSKGSVASSGDDDVDSLQSFSMSIADHSTVRKVGVFSSSKVQSLSKKPSRVLSSSAPKRSFDSALRQMDRRSPQKMFRPLLSSVPSTTFHAGKASSSHRSVISRNSSVTTSSNARSEQWASLPPDNEGADHDEDHRASEWGKTPYPDVQDDVYVFDRLEEDVGYEIHDDKPNIRDEHFGSDKSEVKLGECENISQEVAVASESACILDEVSEADIQQNKVTCSKCGKDFVSVTLPLEEGEDICTVCFEGSVSLPLPIPEASLVTQSSTIPFDVTIDIQSSEGLDSEDLLHELQESTSMSEPMLVQEEMMSDDFLVKSMEERDKISMDQQAMSQSRDYSSQSTADSADQQPPHSNAHPSLKIDVSQGVGMSILLKRSSSSKGSVVQGRTFTATNAPFDDFSYGRESMNSLRSSIGHGSASTSSSIDLTSSRQTDARVQRQSSHRKGDADYSRHGMNIKQLSRGSSFSGTSNHTHHTMVFDMSTSEENFDVSTERMEFEALEETLRIADEQLNDVQLDSFENTDVFEEHKLDHTGGCRMMDAPASELVIHASSVQLMDSSDTTYPEEDTRISSGNAEESTNNASSPDIEEVSNLNHGASLEEVTILGSDACGIDVVEEPTHDSCIMMSELGTDDDCHGASQDESACTPNLITTEDELLVPTNSEKDEPDPASESCTDLTHDILGESTVTLEGSSGQKSRSLTLEEATDTILFCSSIIQNLAYTAANIGMEKETENSLIGLEGSRPTVTLLGKSSPDPRTKSSNNKRTPNKSRQKRVETTTTAASPKKTTELLEIKTHHVSSPPRDTVAPNSKRPLNPESKCNCTVM